MDRSKTVYGKCFRAPHLTQTGIWLAVLYVGVPILAAATLADALIWLIGKSMFGVCLALWCVF